MSDSSEQQPSTGVLGRIGSWFSPWRGNSPKSPTENASPTTDQSPKSDTGDECEESVNVQEGEPQWGEVKEQDFNPSPLHLARDIFLCEQDATQSAHKHSSVVSSTGTRLGDPKEEEFVVCKKKRIGQDQKWEESSNGTSVSGDPEKNASHLTHLSSFSKQGVVWESDQAHTQPHVQTGKRFHVYLEETSVTHGSQDTCAGQEVVRTEVTKSFKVLTKAKSSPCFDLSNSFSSTCAENKRTSVRHAVGAQSCYSALAGVSLKSQKDAELEPEHYKEETEADSMGRKNSSRRRHRKNSQGDGGNSPREKTPPNAQTAPEGFPSATSPQGKSLKAHMGESSVSSASQEKPASQASPETVQSETSCPDKDMELDTFQGSTSVPADAPTRVVDVGVDMEDDGSLYKVERKTETPESKRRSIKVSRSEVKLFTKYVPLNPKDSPAGSSQDLRSGLKNNEEKPQTETDARQPDLKKADEDLKLKPVTGRIADKISLFEQNHGRGGHKQTLHSPRSADASPVRKAPERTKAFVLSNQRLKSAEGQRTARSSSASPIREKLMSIKERSKNFTWALVAEATPAQPQRAAMTGMSQELPPATESTNLDSQGKLDTKESTETAVSEIPLKPDGQDPSTEQISVPQEPPASKTPDKVASETANQEKKSNSVEPVKGASDSSEMTNNIRPESTGPSKTSSRPKRRKSKDPTSPVSPNSETRTQSKLEVAAEKPKQVDDTKTTVSDPKQPTGKVSSDKAQRNASDKQKEQPKKSEVSGNREEQIEPSLEKENPGKAVNTQEEPPAKTDEPDTTACDGGAQAGDKDPLVLPQKEKKSGGHCPTFKQGREMASEDSRKTLASLEMPSDQESPVEYHKVDKEPLVESKGEVFQPSEKGPEQRLQPEHKDTERINQEKLKAAINEKANHTKKKDKDQPQCSNMKTTEGKDSDSERGVTQGEEGVDHHHVKTKEKSLTNKEPQQPKPDSQSPENTSGSSSSTDQCVQPHVSHTETTHPEKAAVGAVAQANEALSGTEGHERPLKREPPTNVPPELQTKSTQSPGNEKKPVVSAAEPRPNSAALEKTENSPDDSRSHGARDEFSGSEAITKATTAAGEVTVKATNDTPALITAQPGNKGEKESSIKEPSPISVSKSVCREAAMQDGGGGHSTVKSVPSEVGVSGDIIKLAPSHPPGEESEKAVSKSDSTSPKCAEKIAPERSAAKSTVNATEKILNPVTEPPPVANGGSSLQSQPLTITKEPVSNKPCPTPKALPPPEANKLTRDSIQNSSMKRLNSPWGQSRDDFTRRQDAPSSWLDVDLPKGKVKAPEPKLSNSGSEGNILDELDDNDFVEKIKKLCAPFSLPPRKHTHLRPSQPHFAMPAIKEDRFEKTFDPEEFQIGLRKKTMFTLDRGPSLLAQLQKTEAKSALKPARASLADRSMLLNSLDTNSRLREKNPVKVEEDNKEEKDEQNKVRSRLEGSCILNSLTSSSFRAKRNGLQTPGDGTISGDVSPSEAGLLSPPSVSQSPLPSPTSPGTVKNEPAKQSPALIQSEEAQAAEAVVCDSGPPLPSFNDIKLPDYLEKYLPREQGKAEQSVRGQEQAKNQMNGNMTTLVPGGKTKSNAKTAEPLVPKAAPPRVPGLPPTTQPPPAPELKQPPAQPQVQLSRNIRAVRSFHKRPGKMVLFEEAQFSGQAHEIYRDVADATSLRLSPLVSVKVVRGCWILYEKPDFQGRSIALEEGAIELTNEWAEPEVETEPHNLPAMVIGSVRLAVRDYSIPRIDLFTEPEGHGRVTPYHDDTLETGSFGIPLSTASIQVHSGVWLVFSDPGFQGMLAMLEPGEYPYPETWGFPSPFVGSLRPLKMGGFKVENPSEVKAVVYEEPNFEGSFLEIDSDVFSFCGDEGDIAPDGAISDSKRLKAVGSVKIIGGLWVGFSQPGFEGQQYILEEGEYPDRGEWGGSEQLLSLRPILADFMAPHLKMFTNRDFAELGENIDLTGPVSNMDDTGYGVKTQSVEVTGGVWVVFEEPDFCGETYVLERGLYGSPEDWGALQPRVASVMPVVLEDFENAAKFKVQLFSDPDFQGSVLPLEDSTASLQDGFSVASCKVLDGSWLAFEGRDFSGRMYVLEVGSYPDLRAMGCDNASSPIQSLQTVGFEFSLPAITLFERCGLRGRRVVLTDGSVNLQLAGGCGRVQSVLVEGGVWVLYERINYQGAQILLTPGEVLDWRSFSGWVKIGSMRPLIQKQAHFRLRNQQTGLMMSVTGTLDDIKLMRIQEMEENGGLEQIWFYQNGHLHCKLLEECCLSPSGSVTIAGSRTGLSPEPGMHLWSITPEGFIRYTPTADLVLEVKGGVNYDKKHVILNSLDPNKLQQRWNIEIL